MKLLILDRDGVINEQRDGAILAPDDCIPIRGSAEAIARLCHAGYRIVVAAFRTGLESGAVDLNSLNRIHQKLQLCAVTAGGHLDALFFSPASEQSETASGAELLREIADRLNIELTTVTVVGGSPDSIRAAQAVGARAVLLRTGVKEGAEISKSERVEAFEDLSSFAKALLSLNGSGT